MSRIPQSSYNSSQVHVEPARNPQPIPNSHFVLPQQVEAPEVVVEKRGNIIAITQRINLNERTRTRGIYNNKSEPQLSQIKQNQIPHQEPQAFTGKVRQIQHSIEYPSQIEWSRSSESRFSQYQINDTDLNQGSSVKQTQQVLYAVFGQSGQCITSILTVCC